VSEVIFGGQATPLDAATAASAAGLLLFAASTTVHPTNNPATALAIAGAEN